ncbi:hypothetical protein RT761_01746 [Atribacter laminatus]|uniref:Uncharacterized protein n=1 Tax=Atribacter laminatus TaxID=2847778 RepID=A0A7T1AM93_ATRLM|nr:hypothetical protein RT761_01746 [Atribacter laminatus]
MCGDGVGEGKINGVGYIAWGKHLKKTINVILKSKKTLLF